jgi:hypothetical protein
LFGACTNPKSQWYKNLLALEDTIWYLCTERSSKRTATVDYGGADRIWQGLSKNNL